jgi:hypothetical protein
VQPNRMIGCKAEFKVSSILGPAFSPAAEWSFR